MEKGAVVRFRFLSSALQRHSAVSVGGLAVLYRAKSSLGEYLARLAVLRLPRETVWLGNEMWEAMD